MEYFGPDDSFVPVEVNSFDPNAAYWDPRDVETVSSVYDHTSWWDDFKDFGSGALDFSKDVLKYGSQIYGVYKKGQGAVVDRRGGLVYNMPVRAAREPMRYEMQAASPAMPASTRVSVGSQAPGGAGINMNMVLIGGAVILAAFMMKGK